MLQPAPFLTFNQTGQFHIHLPRRPDSGSVTASLYDPSGALLGTASVTIDNATSSVNAAATVGATSLNIGSTTNFRVGHRYLVGNSDPEEYSAEFVTIKSKTTNTVTLLRPLMFDHSSGDPFAGTQVDMTVSSSLLGTIGQGYRVAIDYRVSGSAQPTQHHAFDVVRYYPVTNLNIETLRDLDPTLTKKVPSGTSFEDLRTQTWEMICNRIRANYSPGSLVGACILTQAHAYLIRSIMAEIAGPDYIEYRNLMAQRFEEEFKVAMSAATFDADQDGATNGPLDKYRVVMKLARR